MVIDARERFAERTAQYIINLSREEATKRLAIFPKEHVHLIVKIVKRNAVT